MTQQRAKTRDVVYRTQRGRGHPVAACAPRHRRGGVPYSTTRNPLGAAGADETDRWCGAEVTPAVPPTWRAVSVPPARPAQGNDAGEHDAAATQPTQRRVRELGAKIRYLREHCDRLDWEAAQLTKERQSATLEVQTVITELAQVRENLAVDTRSPQYNDEVDVGVPE